MLSEKDLQKQCIAYMKLKNIVYTHQGNEFIRGAKQWRIAKASGMIDGVPDLIVFLPKAKVIFIELKVGKNDLQLNQIEFMERVKALDFEYHVVRDFETFIKVVENENI